jgi:hypothetical protein
MKARILLMIGGMIALMAVNTMTYGQKVDEERMQRDIEIAENVLATLIKQQFSNERTFFPIEVEGTYQQGYGVTFTMPADFTVPIIFGDQGDMMVWSSEPGGQFKVNNSTVNNEDAIGLPPDQSTTIGVGKSGKSEKLKDRSKEKRRLDLDSVRDAYNVKVLEAAKTFLVDYGDMITQLSSNEKIVITNQNNQPVTYAGRFFNSPKRSHLSTEILKSDLTAFKQGKINRNQAMSKIKVMNTQTVEAVEPDLELLSSIFNRLYRADLSKTYFTEDNIYYEHLKDFGVIFYMQVFSTNGQQGYDRFSMPTVGLNDIDLETRNKKVTELYPKFEQDLKENIVEYGKTIKSLKDDEVLVFQVRVTRCPQCGIPSTIEYVVKGSVLKDFNAGKLDKNGVLSKVTVKKGANQ